MSMYIDFEPHSWYMGTAIKHNIADDSDKPFEENDYEWKGYLENGWNYTIVEFSSSTLKDLKRQIKDWHNKENERISNLYKGVN